MIIGWLFDAYPLDEKIILWIIQNNQPPYRIEQSWLPSIYVVSSQQQKLYSLTKNKEITSLAKEFSFISKFERPTDTTKSKVLQIKTESRNIIRLARKIESLEKFGIMRLYNVDIPPEQTYFYENDIFPLGKFTLNKNRWESYDSIMNTDYDIPDLKKSFIKINPKKKGKLPQFSDKIDSIVIDDFIIQSETESDTILEFVKTIEDIDPDFILTQSGDSFEFPYLIYRANVNKIANSLVLGREKTSILASKRTGNSYFSYGRMLWKPSAIKLHGRVHLDISNCFLWNDDRSLYGLYEVSRICRMPLQTAARASIGKCMSSVQFYNATKRDLLVPYKPVVVEIFKTRAKLMIGDRGGFILEPRIGVFENVGEIDFSSLFASIMSKKNISAETIQCDCCPDSESFVPDLGYHICKRKGIVPSSLECLIQKRKFYNDLIKSESDENKKRIYEERKSALKWILVTSFGYLGFNNAKFGRIDAHMAVCAFARKLLIQAIRIAERNGFSVLHGIVDSLWIQKDGATKSDYLDVANQIEKETGFDVSTELYKWIVFLPSKEREFVPVANRYFGARDDNMIKIRGIEARRHDTPSFFKRCEMEILWLLARGDNLDEVRKLLPEAKKIYEKYLNLLNSNQVPLEELTFTTRTSKDAEEYKVNTIQSDAIWQLKDEGVSMKAGQQIQYVISDYSRKRKRSVPLEMSSGKYDGRRYAELLTECYSSIIRPFE